MPHNTFFDKPETKPQFYVLVADDDHLNTELASHIIESVFKSYNIHAQIDIVYSGEEALVRYENLISLNRTYHLTILDNTMTGITGIETAARARELETNLINKSHIVSWTTDNIVNIYAQEKLDKPLKATQLKEIVRKVFDLRELTHTPGYSASEHA